MIGTIIGPDMEPLNDWVLRAKAGDLEAYGRLVAATQAMVYAVAVSVLRDSSLAEDAAQETYLRAFRRLADLEDPTRFAGWLRRIVITVALNMRRCCANSWCAGVRRSTAAGLLDHVRQFVRQ